MPRDAAPGATHADLLALLSELATLIRNTKPAELDRHAIADALEGFADTLGNLADHVVTRDALTVTEWRAEIGLCQDFSHWIDDCDRLGCPNAHAGVQPSPVDSLGRTS